VDHGQGSKAVGEKKEDLCNAEIDLFIKRDKNVGYWQAARILQNDKRQNKCVTIYRKRWVSQKQNNDETSAILQ